MDQVYNLGADSLEKRRTWVDAAYAIHPEV
jgi:hypothetical protein